MILRRAGKKEWLEYRGPILRFIGSICLIIVITSTINLDRRSDSGIRLSIVA